VIRGYVIGDAEVVKRLHAVPERVQGKLRDTIGRLVLKLQRRVMQDKLSGQVLKVRTGTLRRSIDQRVETTNSGVVGIVSTNLKYGKAHEFGSNKPVTVKAHLRIIKQAWGRPLAAPVTSTVRAHQRLQKLPERSFLRSALRDMQPEVIAALDKAVGEGIKP